MAENWVMPGKFRGELTAPAAALFQRLAEDCKPGEVRDRGIRELLPVAQLTEWRQLEGVLSALSEVSVSLLAAPEGWVCAGSSLLEWSVSGDMVRWRIPAHVHAAFVGRDAPNLGTLLPFVRSKGRTATRSLRLYCFLHRAAVSGGRLEVPAAMALQTLELDGATPADARRYGTDRALRDVAALAPHLTTPRVEFVRDWMTPGGPLAKLAFTADPALLRRKPDTSLSRRFAGLNTTVVPAGPRGVP